MPCSLCGQSGHNIRTCMKHHPTKTHSTMTREEWKGLWKNREFLGIVGSIDMLPEGVIQMIGDFLPHKSVVRLSSVNRQLNQDLKEQYKQSRIMDWRENHGIKENDTIVSLNNHYRKIKNVAPLAGLTALTELRLYLNQIQDVTPLAGLTALTELDLGDNQIQDVSPLAGLTALTELDLDDNQIQDVTPLTGLTALTKLNLRGNQIQDITPLVELTALQILYIDPHLVNDIVLTNGIRINPREW